jgi:hypothetical protein
VLTLLVFFFYLEKTAFGVKLLSFIKTTALKNQPLF